MTNARQPWLHLCTPFQFRTSERPPTSCPTAPHCPTTLHAGSERVGKSGATGDQLTEAKNINKSLTTLGRVVTVRQQGEQEGAGRVKAQRMHAEL